MTPLIDVIFLLLMFFMLASTFAREAEFDLALAGAGPDAALSRPLFVQLRPDGLSLNGVELGLDRLDAALGAHPPEAPVLVSVGEGVEAQGLVDVLAALRASGRSARVLR